MRRGEAANSPISGRKIEKIFEAGRRRLIGRASQIDFQDSFKSRIKQATRRARGNLFG
jgi:hypothetical protein